MIEALRKCKSPKSQTTARVVDGKLILTCPQAITPVVWQMELNDVKASALEVLQEGGKKGHFALTLKTPQADDLTAASFETREEAVEALSAASSALENAYGHIRTGQAPANTNAHTAAPQKKQSRPGRWIAGILGVIVLILLFGIWGNSAPRSPNSFQQPSSANMAAQPTNPADSAGVPISADDFLSRQ